MSDLQELLAAAGKEGWSPDEVPPVSSEAERARYAELAARIYAETEGRFATPEQRAHSPKGRLASALWTRVSQWEDRTDETE
jgi:hypothetical protein